MIRRDGDRMLVSGALNLASVAEALSQGNAAIAEGVRSVGRVLAGEGQALVRAGRELVEQRHAHAQTVPQLAAADVLAATYHKGDGLADPNGVVAGYIAAARRVGVKAFTDTTVTGIIVVDGQICGVETGRGRIACETIVNAAGPWSAQISDLAGIPLPVMPVRRQMLTTTPLPDVPTDFPFIIDFAQSLYFHREGEGLLTGMSNPHEKPGYHEGIDHDWELTHMEAAIQRLPPLAKAGRMAHWAGLYEVTPDAHPIYGAVPGLNGYYVVTGFSGHGFMHGPISGLLMSEIILDGQATTLDVTSLSYQRFAEGRLIQEYNVI